MGYRLKYTRKAEKDARKLEQAGLDKKAKELLKIIRDNPFENPPPYEKLIGDLKGLYSKRINIQHRIVYEVLKEEKEVVILRMWSHCE